MSLAAPTPTRSHARSAAVALVAAALVGVWLVLSPGTSPLPQRPGRVPGAAAVRGASLPPVARAADRVRAQPTGASPVETAAGSRPLPHRHAVLRRSP